MSEIKGFEVVPNPQRGAEQWFELFRSESERKPRPRSLRNNAVHGGPPTPLSTRIFGSSQTRDADTAELSSGLFRAYEIDSRAHQPVAGGYRIRPQRQAAPTSLSSRLGVPAFRRERVRDVIPQLRAPVCSRLQFLRNRAFNWQGRGYYCDLPT